MASTSTAEAMDVQESVLKGVKRKSCDDDPQEITLETKKNIEPPEKDMKDRCLQCIVQMYDYLLVKAVPQLEERDEARRDIDLADTISDIIFSVNIYGRRSIIPGETNSVKVLGPKEFKIVRKTQEILVRTDEALKSWKAFLNDKGMEYNTDAMKQDGWFRTMSHFITMFTGFKLRFNEIILGTSTMFIKKKNGSEREIEMRSLGLTGVHQVLLDGITYPAEKRLSMAQSVGPLTAAICLMGSNKASNKKWKTAFTRAFNGIGRITDIADYLASGGLIGNETILGFLGDIALIASSGVINRIFFPINMFAMYASDRVKNNKEIVFDTTGRGGFWAYKWICDQKLQWGMSVDMPDGMLKELIFHAMFGTHTSDLSILAEITNYNTWSERSAIRKSFTREKKDRVLQFTELISYTKYSNMSVTSQTDVLAARAEPVVSEPSLSGQSNQRESYIDYLVRTRGFNRSSIVSHLQTVFDSILPDPRLDTQMCGTMYWHDMASLTDQAHGNELKDFCPTESGHLFGN